MSANLTDSWRMKSVRLSSVVLTISSEMLTAALPVEENEENCAKTRDANREENLTMHELEATHTEAR